MIEIPLGNLIFQINGIEIPVTPIELQAKTRVYTVDKLYKIPLDLTKYLGHDVLLECILISDKKYDSGPDTGENLALITFHMNKDMVSVGFLGDIPNVKYVYLKDRIQIMIPKEVGLETLPCNIAWLTMKNPELEEDFTMLAADPLAIYANNMN